MPMINRLTYAVDMFTELGAFDGGVIHDIEMVGKRQFLIQESTDTGGAGEGTFAIEGKVNVRPRFEIPQGAGTEQQRSGFPNSP